MKYFISAPNIEGYMKYVKYKKLNPREVFYCNTPKRADELCRIHCAKQGIKTKIIILDHEDIKNIPND
mgnify:CR=1 FL=1|tara:strand:- start:424 stop:627 length:204 start_codon:yes stop_codon:yes gene_type:complete